MRKPLDAGNHNSGNLGNGFLYFKEKMMTKKRQLIAGKNRFGRGYQFPSTRFVEIANGGKVTEETSSKELTTKYVREFCLLNHLKVAT